MKLLPFELKNDFPILARQVHGHPLVYLDNAATSQKPRSVIEAITTYYTQSNANVHRGVHSLGDESTQDFTDSKARIASFFGADNDELILTRNTTESINQVAYWCDQHVSRGDVILTTEMEHHSNLVPWQELCRRKGAILSCIRVMNDGQLDLQDLEKLLSLNVDACSQDESCCSCEDTTSECGSCGACEGGCGTSEGDCETCDGGCSCGGCGEAPFVIPAEAGIQKRSGCNPVVKLLALTHVSNTLGTLNPLEAIISLVRKLSPQTKILIDSAQAASHLRVDFHDLDVDFYAMSAHKMLGPMGIGGLLVKKRLLAGLPPFLYGGGMISEVSCASAKYAEDLSDRHTAGTPDVAGVVGWAAACEYLEKIGWSPIIHHDQELVAYTYAKLAELPQVKIVGPEPDKRIGSVAFTYEGVHAHDVAQVLDSMGVAVRSGHHCTMPLHQKFGWPATVRVSFQVYNTLEDIDVLMEALKKVKQVFGK